MPVRWWLWQPFTLWGLHAASATCASALQARLTIIAVMQYVTIPIVLAGKARAPSFPTLASPGSAPTFACPAFAAAALAASAQAGNRARQAALLRAHALRRA